MRFQDKIKSFIINNMESKTGLEEIRHSLAHLLAAAALKKYPKAKLGIGPAIEDGSYYDFLITRNERGRRRGKNAEIIPTQEKDLVEIEAEMRQLIKSGLEFTGRKVTPAEARKIFK